VSKYSANLFDALNATVTGHPIGCTGVFALHRHPQGPGCAIEALNRTPWPERASKENRRWPLAGARQWRFRFSRLPSKHRGRSAGGLLRKRGIRVQMTGVFPAT